MAEVDDFEVELAPSWWVLPAIWLSIPLTAISFGLAIVLLLGGSQTKPRTLTPEAAEASTPAGQGLLPRHSFIAARLVDEHGSAELLSEQARIRDMGIVQQDDASKMTGAHAAIPPAESLPTVPQPPDSAPVPDRPGVSPGPCGRAPQADACEVGNHLNPPPGSAATTRSLPERVVALPQANSESSASMRPPNASRAEPSRVAVATPSRGSWTATPRVFIHYRKDIQAANANALAALLRHSGLEVVAIRQVSATPSVHEIRFFHAMDRTSAADLTRQLRSTEWQVRDFRNFPVPPRAGTLEMWLPDQ